MTGKALATTGLRVGSRIRLHWIGQALLALGCLALVLLALLLQGHLLRFQTIDVGTRLDTSQQYRFYGREHSDTLPGANGPISASYRWARPRSALYFGPLLPGASYELQLTMLAPAPGATLDFAVNGHRLGIVALDHQRLRSYRLLVAPAWLDDGLLELGLDGAPSILPGDPRRPIVLVDAATVRTVATSVSPLAQLWVAPYLPLGIILLLLLGFGLRLSGAAILPPTLVLAGIAYLLRHEPATARTACHILLVASGLALAVFAAVALLHRLPRLLPHTDRSAAAWIIGGFLVALLLFFTPRIASDGVLYYVYLRSLAIDGDWDFGNEFSAESTLDHVLEVGDDHRLPSGYFGNAASVGPAIVWTPFFGLAHGVVFVGRAFGLPWQPDGYTQPYLVLVSLASALGALGTMLGCYHISRRFTGPNAATLAALTVFFGSNLLFYGLAESSFAHALSALAATLLVLAWLRLEERPTTARWVQVGLATGATTLMYWITALLLIMPLLTGLRLLGIQLRARRWPEIGRLVAQGALAVGLALLVISPQLIAWSIIYGAPLAAPHGADYITPKQFHLEQVLFSPLYGLLPWTPAFFAGLVGLALLPLRRPWLGACMLAACLLYIAYNASLSRWFAGGSFGLRRLTACAPFFAVGLALLFEQLARWRRALPPIMASLMIAWAIAVLVRYQGYLLSHSAYSLKFMSPLQFYLDGNALPLWALPGLIGNSYPLGLLRGAARPDGLLYLLLLGGAMTLCIAGVIWGYLRITNDQVVTDLQ